MIALLNMTDQSKYHLTVEQINAELEQVKAAQDDPRKFELIYKTYYARIVGYVYQRVDSKDLAYEITAQVFYSALNNLSKFKAQGVPFGAWLFRIAGNELNQWFRKNKTQRTINIDEEAIGNLKQEVDERVSANIDKDLFQALEELELDELDLIDMRFFEDRSFKEICEITGMGESACKMRIYRILEKLKTKLKNI
ncbi:MAG: sigma-70 family RNA polymerase sigma factor [Bacteroidetes bacterium]|nr:sigma-70 family RNA polymerase sigma factor [Bacteroidota bacterium]